MANQNASSSGLGGNGGQNVFNNFNIHQASNQKNGNPVLPQNLQDVVNRVDIDDLMRLTLNPTLNVQIERALNSPALRNWFRHTYVLQLDPRLDHPLARRIRFENNATLLPQEIENLVNQVNGETERRQFRRVHLGIHFVQQIFDSMVPQYTRLAEDFVAALNLVQPRPLPPPFATPYPPVQPQQSFVTAASTPNSPSPEPASPQSLSSIQSSTITAPSTIASVASNSERRLWCPRCNSSVKEENFRGLKHHWFTNHARSNRSAEWLKQQKDKGKCGPWTEDEKKQSHKGKRAETNDERLQRKKMKRGAPEWRKRMQNDPEKWEKKAQEEDGHSDYDDSFISTVKQKRAQGRAQNAQRKEAERKETNKRKRVTKEDKDESNTDDDDELDQY